MHGPSHLVRKGAARRSSFAFIGLGLALALVCLAACTGTATFEQNLTGGSPTATIGGGGSAATAPPPTVTSVSPASGPSNGGTVITVTGTNFASAAAVVVGGTAATQVSVLNSSSIRATTAAHAAGSVEVQVVNSDSQSGVLLNSFTYTADPAPQINFVSPSSGESTGGTTIFITGFNFVDGATVLVGGGIATSVIVSSSLQIQAVTPPGPVGVADVRVQNPDSQVGILAGSFTYTQGIAPTLTSVAPNSGPSSGGTVVTITGTNFLTGASVRFGGVAATSVTVSSPTQLMATTPAHAPGVVDVVVINPDNQSATRNNAYNFLPGPAVTSVSPGSGPATGGTTVTITGTNFQVGSTAFFGTIAAASTTRNSATQITALTPASAAGTVDVSVSNPDGQIGALVGSFVFTASAAPMLTSIAPTSGPTAGGTTVTLTGTGFLSGASVLFGTDPASSVTVVSSTQIQAVSPAGAAGSVTIQVSNPDAQSAALPNAFTFLAPPNIANLSPNSGPTGGGTQVVISGSDFQTGATVLFGGTAATIVVVSGPSQIVATTPAHAIGVVDVQVTNPDTQFGVLTGGFTYQLGPAPVVTGVAPNSGPTAGGTTVTISGSNFVSGATVRVGGSPATNVVFVDSAQITARTPAGTAGGADVQVINPDLQSATLTNGFNYVPPPAPTTVAPNRGPVTGGTFISITGTNFQAGATVTVGGTPATSVNFVSPTQLTAVTPAHAAGTVNVVATNPDGQTGTSVGAFTFDPPPDAQMIVPNTGTTAGGNNVTITGAAFQNGATVSFGASLASSVVFVNSMQLTAVTPPQAAGAVNVTVTNPDGQQDTLVGAFTFSAPAPPPTVTNANPTSGPTSGGTLVTIDGTNFQNGATAWFGGTMATVTNFINVNQVTAVTPAQIAGTMDVSVRNPDGATGTLPNSFTFLPPPTVTTVSPNFGPTAGGTAVTITGSGFQANATVLFGGNPATSVVVVSPTQITAVTPAGAGIVAVQVTNPDGQSGTLNNAFTFQPPTVSSVNPNSGLIIGNTSVTINGANFVSGATVTFGGTAATMVVFVNANQLTAVTPAHAAGAVNVVVTNPDGQSGTRVNGFTYIGPPTVTMIAPNSGPAAGGTSVTITGTGFQTGATVMIGANPATSVMVISSTQISAITPAGAAGAANVVVRNPDTQTGTLAGGFTFVPPPSVTSVVPNSGFASGGTLVAVNGANFVSGATITFGGTPATSVVFVDATQLMAVTPAHIVGMVNVLVRNPDNQSGTLANGFTYTLDPAPVVTGVAPNSGPAAGNTSATILGSDFQAGATVLFGGVVGIVTGVTPTQIATRTPAHAAGLFAVEVRNPDGQSGILNNAFTFDAAPTVSSVAPNSGPTTGGTLVTIMGTGFQMGAGVFFGSTASTMVIFNSAMQLTATSPPGPTGAVSVQVRNPDNQNGTLNNAFTYTSSLPAPTVSSVSPNAGPDTGLSGVMITGSNFQTGATVMFGGSFATSVVVASATLITAITPAHVVGGVSVVVTNPDGQMGTLANGFTYTLTSLPGQILPPAPTLPTQVSVCPGNNCPMPDTTGYTTKTVCSSGCDYTNVDTATNTEACGAGKIISVRAGQTFTGNVSIPAKTCNAGKWFIVQSSAVASLPTPGTRVSPADMTNMPTLRCSTAGVACFLVRNSSSRVYLRGLFLTVPASGSFNQTDAMLALGDLGDLGQTTTAKIPTELVAEQLIIVGGTDGDSTKQVRAGVSMQCNHCALVDSYVAQIHQIGFDTQAVRSTNCNGPLLIQNNFLEAAGENIITGGNFPFVPGPTWPKDMTIRRNYIFKPLSWKVGDPTFAGVHWLVKNLLEMKAASRVLIEGNVFENIWADAQIGTAVVLNDCPSNSNVGMTVDNITFRYNKIIGAQGTAMGLAGGNGCQDNGSSNGSFNIAVHDNLFINQGAGGGRYVLMSTLQNRATGENATTFRHNTMIMTTPSNTGSVFAFEWFLPTTPFTGGLAVHDNIFGTGASTSNQKANSTGSCGAICYTANSWFKNLVYRTSPTSTFCPTIFSGLVPWGRNKAACVADIGNVGFMDLAGGDFRLAAGTPGKNAASDGRDVGADINAVEAITAGVKP